MGKITKCRKRLWQSAGHRERAKYAQAAGKEEMRNAEKEKSKVPLICLRFGL